ncbi:MAG: hypothetical protein IH845_04635 [Nanoarchaeota archaeon]|nr:hypothetical protein [Nanoarchaeota archaeon]
MFSIKKFFSQCIGQIPGDKKSLTIFLLIMGLLVPFVKWLDLWQVSIALIVLIIFGITKDERYGIASVWFTIAVVLHNIWAFILLVIGFKLGIYLLP